MVGAEPLWVDLEAVYWSLFPKSLSDINTISGFCKLKSKSFIEPRCRDLEFFVVSESDGFSKGPKVMDVPSLQLRTHRAMEV